MILVSVSSVVLQNALFNFITKKKLSSTSSVLSFNMLVYLVCIAAFGIVLLTGTVSWYTVGLGAVFGIVTSLSNVLQACAYFADAGEGQFCWIAGARKCWLNILLIVSNDL